MITDLERLMLLRGMSEAECNAIRDRTEACRPCRDEDLYPRLASSESQHPGRDDVTIYRCQRCQRRKIQTVVDPVRLGFRVAPITG